MILKLVEHVNDGFRLIEGRDITFRRLPGPVAIVDGVEYAVLSKAFVLNASGDTVDKFFSNIQEGRKS